MPSALRGLDVLDHVVQALWESSLSHRTNTVYNTGIKSFRHFLAMYNLNCNSSLLPKVNEDILLYYVAFCHQVLHLKYTTIKMYLAGIRRAYVAGGFTNPLMNEHNQPLVRLQGVLRGVKKVQGTSTVVRQPITADVLASMRQALQHGIFGPYVDLLLETACTVAFFGFLRCGEFTSRDNTYDPAVDLSLRDVFPAPQGQAFILRLKASKTDPFRQGVNIYLHRTGLAVCPWRTLTTYLRVRNILNHTDQDPLFLTPEGGIMSRAWFLKKLQALFVRIGISEKYTGHSFRSGAATSAAKANIPDHLIKTLGRWSSDSYCRYVKTPQALIKNAQLKMCL